MIQFVHDACSIFIYLFYDQLSYSSDCLMLFILSLHRNHFNDLFCQGPYAYRLIFNLRTSFEVENKTKL